MAYAPIYFALAVLTAAAFWNRRELRAPARIDGVWTVVEYPKAFRALCLFTCIFLGAVFLHLLLKDVVTMQNVGFAALGETPFVVITLWVWRTRIRFSTEELEIRTTFRRERTIERRLLGVPHVAYPGWVVDVPGHGRVRINPGQCGYRELLLALRGESHTSASES